MNETFQESLISDQSYFVDVCFQRKIDETSSSHVTTFELVSLLRTGLLKTLFGTSLANTLPLSPFNRA